MHLTRRTSSWRDRVEGRTSMPRHTAVVGRQCTLDVPALCPWPPRQGHCSRRRMISAWCMRSRCTMDVPALYPWCGMNCAWRGITGRMNIRPRRRRGCGMRRPRTAWPCTRMIPATAMTPPIILPMGPVTVPRASAVVLVPISAKNEADDGNIDRVPILGQVDVVASIEVVQVACRNPSAIAVPRHIAPIAIFKAAVDVDATTCGDRRCDRVSDARSGAHVHSRRGVSPRGKGRRGKSKKTEEQSRNGKNSQLTHTRSPSRFNGTARQRTDPMCGFSGATF
jgi:hypothetical protein